MSSKQISHYLKYKDKLKLYRERNLVERGTTKMLQETHFELPQTTITPPTPAEKLLRFCGKIMICKGETQQGLCGRIIITI